MPALRHAGNTSGKEDRLHVITGQQSRNRLDSAEFHSILCSSLLNSSIRSIHLVKHRAALIVFE